MRRLCLHRENDGARVLPTRLVLPDVSCFHLIWLGECLYGLGV